MRRVLGEAMNTLRARSALRGRRVVSAWSVARDTVARELYSTLCLYGTGYPPAWEDLDNGIREAWAQVAFGEAAGSATIDDFGDNADRSVSVSVSKTAPGPKFAIVARTVETDAGGSKAVEVVIVPVDSRGRFDFDGVEPIAEFVEGGNTAPRVVSLFDLLGCEETGESGALAAVAVALNVGDEVVVEVTTKAAGVAVAVEDTHARAFLTGET